MKKLKCVRQHSSMKVTLILVFLLIINPVFAQDISLVTTINDHYSYNGIGNNIEEPTKGSANLTLLRIVTPAYNDGISSLSNENSPNPRLVSNLVCEQQPELDIIDERNLSNMNWVWGQFMFHDIGFTPTAIFDPSLRYLDRIQILAPQNDQFYEVNRTMMSVFRSLYDVNTGTSKNNPREQINILTAWMDGSVIYGTSKSRSDKLRTFDGGKLKVSQHNSGDLLPIAPVGSLEEKQVRGQAFFAGEPRSNEHIAITALHTLFVREHNRIAKEIHDAEPSLTDEEIFQKARKINAAIIQSITYNEFLPSLGIELDEYRGYNKSTDPQISHIFSVVAFRIGHSQVGERLTLVNSTQDVQSIPMKETFFNPVIIHRQGIDSILRGLFMTNQQANDIYYHNSIRNFLFDEPQRGGLDLCVLDIIRGRDHGIPDYNSVRKEIGLNPVEGFDDINNDEEVRRRLRAAYGNIDELDAIIGILAEEHLEGSTLGQTGYLIIKDQFERIRDGDRLFYLNDPDLRIIKEEISNTSLAEVIERNTEIKDMPDNVFFVYDTEPEDNRSILEQQTIWVYFLIFFIAIFAIYLRFKKPH